MMVYVTFNSGLGICNFCFVSFLHAFGYICTKFRSKLKQQTIDGDENKLHHQRYMGRKLNSPRGEVLNVYKWNMLLSVKVYSQWAIAIAIATSLKWVQ